MDLAPAKADAETADGNPEPGVVEHFLDLGSHDAARAERAALLDDGNVFGALQGREDRLAREWAVRLQSHEADLLPLVARLIDHVLNRAADRTFGDEDRFGVVALILFEKSAGVSAEGFGERGARFLDDLEAPQTGVVDHPAAFHALVGLGERAERRRVVHVEFEDGLVGT